MKEKSKSAKPKRSVPTHKLGANLHDPAKRQRKRDQNFKQSRDVREDRGVRKLKTEAKPKGQER